MSENDRYIIITGGRNYGKSLLHAALKAGLINELPSAQLAYDDLKVLNAKLNEWPVHEQKKADEIEKELLELYEGTKLEFKPYHVPEIDTETRIIRSSFGFKKSRKCNNSKRPKPRKKKRK